MARLSDRHRRCAARRRGRPHRFRRGRRLDWRVQPSPTEEALLGIGAKDGLFIAVGDYGTILRSVGGREWERIPSPTGANLTDAVVLDGFIAIVGQGGTILTSTDQGRTFQQQISPTNRNLWGVTYGRGTFAAVGNNAKIVNSFDGFYWF